MDSVFSPDNDEARLLLLLSLLVVGVLLYFPVSPGPYLADTPEVLLPLGIVGGLCGFVYVMRFHWDGERFNKRSAYFGWLGAAAGGIAGLWLTIHHLPMGFSFSQVYSDGLTVLSLGTAVGTIGGFLNASVDQRAPHHHVDRDSIVAESTWTKRSGSNPILTEIVEQLSALEESDPLEIEPVGSYFNVDIFEEIRSEDGSPWQVLFYTSEYEIRVSSHGTITVYDVQRTDEGTGASIKTIQ